MKSYFEYVDCNSIWRQLVSNVYYNYLNVNYDA